MDLLESVGSSVQSVLYVSSLGLCLFELFVNLSNRVGLFPASQLSLDV